MQAAHPIVAPTRPVPGPALRPSIIRRARGHSAPFRRDARRFGVAMPRYDAVLAAEGTGVSQRFSDLKLFTHTFAAGFLFMTVFLA